MNLSKKILIVGGGFGGIACALALEKYHHPNYKIILVSEKTHFEYMPALYRVVTGRSPLTVCIPAREIFDGKNIEFVSDKIVSVDLMGKKVSGSSGSSYQFDCLVLALGSRTAYFNIPGLETFSFGFKSITEALRLKRHIHKLFDECKEPHGSADSKMHFVIVGAGASGVELAGELASYTSILAKNHNIPRSIITIDLIEAAPRILPALSEAITLRVEKRLHELGVNIFTNRPILKEEFEEVYLKGLKMKTDTVIWTAGIKPNDLYSKIPGLTFDKKGKVMVDEYLRAKNIDDVFIVGDGASTQYSGMAQTAIYDGRTVAQNIIDELAGRPQKIYKSKEPYHFLPVGPGWALTPIAGITVYGKIGWLLRRFADFRYFLSILPFRKALLAFKSNKTLCESCAVCESEQPSS